MTKFRKTRTITSGPDSTDYREGGTNIVGTYTAADDEDDSANPRGRIDWDLSGTDASDFEISANGVLTFSETPDFENPEDAGGDNVYNVTVEAADTALGGQDADLPVTITVVNVDEAGQVTLSALQPKEGVVFTATLSDPDGGETDQLPISESEKDLTGDATWQWARSQSARGPWTDITATSTANLDVTLNTRTPEGADVGHYLRATASYKDGHTADNVEEPDKSAHFVSANMVGREDYSNTPPEFQDDEGEATTTATRTISENSAAGTTIGAPVVATDPGEFGPEILTYTLVDPSPNAEGDDEDSFTIERASGQIRVGPDTMLNYEATASYTVTVRAADPSDSASTPSRADIEVTIMVTDVLEAPEITAPTSSVGQTEIEFEENNETPTITTYAATDHEDDVASEKDLKWSLIRCRRGEVRYQHRQQRQR